MIKTVLGAAVVASAFAFATPSQAVPTSLTMQPLELTTNIVDVSHRRGYYVLNGVPHYNGYRCRRQPRAGYRQHRGCWFPRAAFSLTVHIAPNTYHQNKTRSSRHVAWCQGRYRTYRVSDNTYVPREGERAYCDSPYD